MSAMDSMDDMDGMDRRGVMRCMAGVTVSLAIALCGCDRSGGSVPRTAAAPDTISVFYTCDTRGHISPCNCTAGVAGGLPRRKSFITQRKSGSALIVDAGDLTAGGRPWELLELEYILRGYGGIGYDAVNIGKREAALPAETLKDLRARYPFLVSANVQDADGNAIFPAFRVVTLDGGYRVAVLGVVGDGLLPDEIGDGVRIAPMREALDRAVPEAKAKADLLVLLAFANEPSLRESAERYFEIAVIVGGDVEQPSGDAVAANKSTIVYVTDKGKSVGELKLRYIGGQYVAEANSITMLLDSVPDDPAMTALVRELERRRVENNFPKKPDDEEGLTAVK